MGENPAKTKAVLFTRKQKGNKSSLPVLDGVTLGLSLSAKYLGKILDQRLKLKQEHGGVYE